jgi:hypothetical protein
MGVHRLSRRIGARSFKGARGYGRIAKYRYLHIFVIGADIFGGFRVCQRFGLVADFPLYRGMTKVSKDGKTRTSTWHGKNAEGKDVHNVVVFDKQ